MATMRELKRRISSVQSSQKITGAMKMISSDLEEHKDAIVEMEGLGQKSYDNLIASIKTAGNTTLPRMVYGLGIAGIGLANAKMLCREFKFDFEKMRHAQADELVAVDGIGGVLAQAWRDYLYNPVIQSFNKIFRIMLASDSLNRLLLFGT